MTNNTPEMLKESAALDPLSLRNRIRQAYLDVTGGRFNRRALLRDLRTHPSLRNIDRPLLDAAIWRMQIEDDAALMPLDCRPHITPADEQAAIPVGNEYRHILWIER